MDSVRFGRALGFGARSAIKALASATDAAIAPNASRPLAPDRQSQRSPDPSAAAPSRPSAAGAIAAKSAARASVQTRGIREGVAQGSKRFGESVLGPLAKLSGILWLEITGSFFGIFALFAGNAAWSHRADLHSTPVNGDARLHLLVFLAMTLVFAYFCISSFLRAYR